VIMAANDGERKAARSRASPAFRLESAGVSSEMVGLGLALARRRACDLGATRAIVNDARFRRHDTWLESLSPNCENSRSQSALSPAMRLAAPHMLATIRTERWAWSCKATRIKSPRLSKPSAPGPKNRRKLTSSGKLRRNSIPNLKTFTAFSWTSTSRNISNPYDLVST
jgi:hypothetical protein